MELKHSILINKSVHEVFAYFVEIENLVLWMDGLQEIEVDADQELGVGAVSRQVITQQGMTFNFQQKITAFEENALFVAHLVSKAMNVQVTFKFKEKDGSCLIEQEQEIKLKTFILKTGKTIVKNLVDKSTAADLERLKTILENE